MKKYDEYKDSGFDWVGKIPTLWNNLRLRFVCEFRNGFTPSKANPEFWEDGSIPWYRMEDIRDSGRKLSEAKQYITEEAIKGGGLFEAGSFIIATTATIGEHAMLIVDSLANQRFTNLKIRESLSFNILSEFFFYYLFIIDDYCKATTKTSTFPAVSMELLKNCHVVFPSIEDQRSIVDYLNQKCSEIDNIISAQQKRIALLQELKQSVITHAVTKGLNPNVKMKPSGVEWIGDVPEHWEVMPLKKYCKMNKGLTFTKADIVDEGEPVISYGQVHSKLNNGVSLDCNLIRHVPIGIVKNGENSKAHKGDFIFADTSEDYEGCGNFVYNDTNQVIYGGYHTIILQTETLNAKYIGYLFKTDCWRYQIRSRVYGVKVYSITQSILSICSIILPPQEEQAAITSYLDHKCATIDTSISNAQHQIELLQEYKQSLITEVVTGKRKIC